MNFEMCRMLVNKKRMPKTGRAQTFCALPVFILNKKYKNAQKNSAKFEIESNFDVKYLQKNRNSLLNID